MADTRSGTDDSRIGSALIIAILGLLIPAILVVILVSKGWNASDVSSIVGVFTSIVGTLVGAFFGVQVGAAGKDKAQNLANRALAALPPETAKAILDR